MPIHQNEDGTWQWGKSGKKYKNKQDAIKQMQAIFASGYREHGHSKKAGLTYMSAYLIKRAGGGSFQDYMNSNIPVENVEQSPKNNAKQEPEKPAQQPQTQQLNRLTGISF